MQLQSSSHSVETSQERSERSYIDNDRITFPRGLLSLLEQVPIPAIALIGGASLRVGLGGHVPEQVILQGPGPGVPRSVGNGGLATVP